ncbi:hypothetical protein QQ008_23995 [Fulvivirgaceae bacterium BMA10]|uniref:Fructose 1,6-bisphosphatase n=1 Tax=Splendidivirga corallicola TaxID=3051826 RepID=A0ABT8KUM1_9BACT|nr:hypothetical protein [Fulvivirgaceae bacterium BMA10]
MSKKEEKEQTIKDQNTNMSQESIDPRIDAIKEIIFGENIKEYEAEFKKLRQYVDEQRDILENAVDSLRSDAERLLEELRNDFDETIASLKDDMHKEITTLNKDKADRKRLGDLLEDIGRKLKE